MPYCIISVYPSFLQCLHNHVFPIDVLLYHIMSSYPDNALPLSTPVLPQVPVMTDIPTLYPVCLHHFLYLKESHNGYTLLKARIKSHDKNFLHSHSR